MRPSLSKKSFIDESRRTGSAEKCTPASSPLTALLVLGVMVAGVTLFAHWPALDSGALFLDDNFFLTENRLVQNPSWASATQFVTEVTKPSTVPGYYQPLTMISLMLDSAMGGRIDDLQPFHRTSLALHVANTVLVIVLFYMLFRHPWAAASIGLLFGVHPLAVETISWVSERKTLLATCFALSSLIVYVQYARRNDWRAFAASMMLYALALISKPTTTPLPLAMLLLDFWPLRRLDKRAWIEKMPFLLIGGVSAIVTVISQRHLELSTYKTYSDGQTILLMCHNLVLYPWHMIWPVQLSSLYVFPEDISLANGFLTASVVINVTLLLLVVVSLRWTRALFAGWLCYCVLLVPTLMNKNYSPSVAWDKYAYLPAVGMLLMLSWAMQWAWSSGPDEKRGMRRSGIVAAVVIAACGLIACTRVQTSYWKTSLDLYNYSISLAPESSVLYFTRSAIHGMRRDYDRVIQDCNMAIALEPGYATAFHNRGMAHHARGDFTSAIRDYSRAIELKPDYAMAYDSRGNSYYKLHNLDQALRDYTKAVEIKGDSPLIFYNRARCFRQMGDYASAVKDYASAIGLQPNYSSAYNSRANAYYSLKQYDKAWADLEMFHRLGGVPSPELIKKLTEASGRSE